MSLGKETDLPVDSLSLGRNGDEDGLDAPVGGGDGETRFSPDGRSTFGGGAWTLSSAAIAGTPSRPSRPKTQTAAIAVGIRHLFFSILRHIPYDPESQVVARFFGIIPIG